MQSSTTTSKNELIKWINETLKLTITSLEQLGTGLAFCQIFDYIYPNTIPATRLNWKATQEVDYIKNFKVLAEAFHKGSITKQFDVQQLAKGKYQDLLDLTQFLKQQFDKMTEKRQNYNPEEYRLERKIITPVVRKSLKDKTNNQENNSLTSKLIKRTAAFQFKKASPTPVKTPQLSQIQEILSLEEDEPNKIKKIRQLFI